MRVGLISDTHGLLRPEALAALQGVEHIIHGGDIGNEEVLQALARIAPLSVVRGNNDTQAWAAGIPETLHLHLAGKRIAVIHDLKAWPKHGKQADVIVSGHSHKPLVQSKEGVLYVNPGSAGPRRFKLPVTVAILEIGDGQAKAEIVALL